MVRQNFLNALGKLKENLETAAAQGIDLNSTPDPTTALYDFKQKRAQYVKDNIQNSLLDVKRKSAEIMKTGAGNEHNEKIAYDLSVQVRFLEEFYKEPAKALPIITQLTNIAAGLNLPDMKMEARGTIDFRVAGLPDDIRSEVHADVGELSKCFSAGCYRSCIILCGRILETTLHRKYYDATGHDVLEKSPGIGLGNLVGKLKDKNIAFDPGLSQQIHLINQVRIFSVHKKQEAFHPTKDQTHAIILYTLDVVRRVLK